MDTNIYIYRGLSWSQELFDKEKAQLLYTKRTIGLDEIHI
jgi:hypothetical protein